MWGGFDFFFFNFLIFQWRIPCSSLFFFTAAATMLLFYIGFSFLFSNDGM
jgi:hypothetical protein